MWISTRLRLRTMRGMTAVAVAAIMTGAGVPTAVAHDSRRPAPRESARLDAANLRLAAQAVQAQAIASGVLRHRIHRSSPAVVLFRTDLALIHAALRRDPRRHPVDTRAVMGPVPYNLAH